MAKILVVNNLKAGQGDAGLFAFIRELSRQGADITLRPAASGASLPAALADAHQFDRVVAAGGDGTVSAAAHLLRNSGIPMLAYPAGTANIIALNLRLPADPKRLARITLEGRALHTDLGELTFEPPLTAIEVERRRFPRPTATRHVGFTGIAGAGFDADIMERARELKPSIGAGAYVVAAMQIVQPTLAKIRLKLDGRVVETEGSAVLFANFSRLQFDLSVAHDSNGSDGLLEVVVIKARYMAELLPAVIAAMIDRVVDFPDRGQVINTYRASQVDVETTPPLPLQADGETLGGSTPCSARVLPLAATFIVSGSVAPSATTK